jgi:hypothetical protein
VTGSVEGTIVSISRGPRSVNLELEQDGSSLFFWFRTPLLVKRHNLTLSVPNVFAANEPRDILLSYDGANLSLYIDGSARIRAYRFGPGTGLAMFIRRVKPKELDGYRYIFYALVFFPAGCLLGFAWRTVTPAQFGRFLLLFFIFLLPCGLLEIVLVRTSGRAISLGGIAFSILFLVAGSLWINADRGALTSRSNEWIARTS